MGILSYIEYPYLWIYQKLLFGGASNLSAAEGINSTETPVLIIHGTEDEVIAYDGPSIMAHQDEITNPNAVFITCSSEGQNGHSNLFMDRDAMAYQEELDEELEQMKAEYGGMDQIPEEVLKEWYAAADSRKASRLDEVFMQDVYKFFKDAEKKSENK